MYGFIYVVTDTAESAKKLARLCVEHKLTACANIIPSILSCYKWEGKYREDREAVLLLKTKKELFDAACSLIKKHHPYPCPCIVFLPFAKGYPPFLSWIESEVSSDTLS